MRNPPANWEFDETPGQSGVQVAALASQTRTLTLTAPSTGVFATASKELFLYYPPLQTEMMVAQDCNAGTGCAGADLGLTISYRVPALELTPYYRAKLVRSGTLDEGNVLVPMTTAAVAVTVPTPPTSVLPSAGAQGIGYGTTFSWTPAPGNKVHALDASWSQLVTPFSYFGLRCYTAGPKCTLPAWVTDVDAAYALPSGATFDWQVVSTDRAGTVDDAATYDEAYLFVVRERFDADVHVTLSSGTRTFNTR